MPTTQDQYIDLDVVTRRLLGRNDLVSKRYNLDRNTVYTTESVQAAQASGDVRDLVVAADAYKEYKTEKVTTWEVGYKSVLFGGKLFLDVFYYNSTYQDFGAEIDVTQAYSIAGGLTGDGAIPTGYTTSEGVAHSTELQQVFVTGGSQGIGLQRYGYDTNIDQDINTYGFGASADLMLFNNYKLSGNATFNKIEDLDDLTQRTYNVAFNTPEWRYNFSISNRKLTDNIGFAVSYRWQDAYLWQSSIGSGIIPDFQTVDAQISYAVPAINGSVKIGGSNLLNERYTTSFANPNVGAIYYIQLNFDNLLNR
jgi:outer membrane receptor protein involved in Fe transport